MTAILLSPSASKQTGVPSHAGEEAPQFSCAVQHPFPAGVVDGSPCLPRVLCVDSSAEVLGMLARFLAPSFEVETANDALKALKLIREDIAPFAVIVTGQLAFLDPIEFLERTRSLSPNTGRVVLTGSTDGEKANQALNSGAVYRFLTKPCRPETLLATVAAAAEFYLGAESERILLERTVRGAVNALTGVLALASPTAFARGMRLKNYIGPLSDILDVGNQWEVEVAAVTSQLGCVSMSPSLVSRLHRGQQLDAAELETVKDLPMTADAFVAQIPRLDGVRRILRHLNTHFDGTNSPDKEFGKRIPMGARILKTVGDLDWLLAGGMSISLALGNLSAEEGVYDPEVLGAVRDKFGPAAQVGVRRVRLRHLQEGMVFAADVKGPRGLLLAAQGQEVGPVLISKLRNVWDTLVLDIEVPVCTRGEYQQRQT